MTRPRDTCSPGGHPHEDRRNFGLEDYLAMCRDGEAAFSIAECARLTGLSRQHVYRMMFLADVPEEDFEAAMADMQARGKPLSTTALVDELKRRTGRARTYVERCPHCGGTLRERQR